MFDLPKIKIISAPSLPAPAEVSLEVDSHDIEKKIASLNKNVKTVKLRINFNGTDNDVKSLATLLENLSFEVMLLEIGYPDHDNPQPISDTCFSMIEKIAQHNNVHKLTLNYLDIKREQADSLMQALHERDNLLALELPHLAEIRALDSIFRAILTEEAPINALTIRWQACDEEFKIFKDLAEIARASFKQIKLKKMQFSFYNISSIALGFITELLKKRSNYMGLQKLHILMSRDDGKEANSQLIPNLLTLNQALLADTCSLQELKLEEVLTDERNLPYLIELIEKNKSLKILDCGGDSLVSPEYSTENFQKIMLALSLNKNIQSFSISGVDFNVESDELGKVVASMLSQNSVLERLDFSYMQLNKDEFLEPIIPVLESGKNERLLKIDLSGNDKISDENLKKLTRILEKRKPLPKENPPMVLPKPVMTALKEVISNEYLQGFLKGNFTLPQEGVYNIRSDDKNNKFINKENICEFIAEKLQQISGYIHLFALQEQKFSTEIIQILEVLANDYSDHQALSAQYPSLVIEPKIIRNEEIPNVKSMLQVLCNLSGIMFSNLQEFKTEQPKQKAQLSIINFFKPSADHNANKRKRCDEADSSDSAIPALIIS